MEKLAAILGFRVAQLSMSYLELLLGARFKSKHIMNSIAKRVDRKLAGWKHMYISKGGCLTLIKSTLSNLHTYFFSSFHIPAASKMIERIQREFLWRGLKEERKLHLVN